MSKEIASGSWWVGEKSAFHVEQTTRLNVIGIHYGKTVTRSNVSKQTFRNFFKRSVEDKRGVIKAIFGGDK
jgi:hypothetical protein